jgi:hypothetical protein
MKRIVLFAILTALSVHGQNYCMRFYGHGRGDIDRVKIRIDAPDKPVDAAYDFTVEYQMIATDLKYPAMPAFLPEA